MMDCGEGSQQRLSFLRGFPIWIPVFFALSGCGTLPRVQGSRKNRNDVSRGFYMKGRITLKEA